jgi:hypothetical protein
MIVDHFIAEVVVNGGARRSARIAVKHWKDAEISKFITIKRDNPWMWSSNNSVGVDQEFWDEASIVGTKAFYLFMEITKSSFEDMTGEPGLINLDKLTIK